MRIERGGLVLVAAVALAGCVKTVIVPAPAPGNQMTVAGDAGPVDICTALRRAVDAADGGFAAMVAPGQDLDRPRDTSDDLASDVEVPGATSTVQLTGVPDFSVEYQEPGFETFASVLATVAACPAVDGWARDEESNADGVVDDVTLRAADPHSTYVWVVLQSDDTVLVMVAQAD